MAMKQILHKWYRSPHLVVAVLLLLTQTFLLLHLTEHSLAPDHEAACSICMTAGHSGSALPSEVLPLPAVFQDDVIVSPLLPAAVQLAFLSPRPRSPPFHP